MVLGGLRVEKRRRIGAYGLCRDGDRVLLVRSSAATDVPGVWQLPGGGLEHGEHPADAVTREFLEETGLGVEVIRPRAAVAEVRAVRDLAWHTDRIVYDVRVTGGTLRASGAEGTSDRAQWFPIERAVGLRLMPFTAELLGAPVNPVNGGGSSSAAPAPPVRADRGQRFAAYGLVTDPDGRVLLTLIAPNYPGAGKWHLPGGGTDFGEQPEAGLLREIAEESGQVGRVVELMSVSDRHNPAALGPEGYPIDWHAVRVVFRVVVDVPTPPRVLETEGSTAEAAWFDAAEAGSLRLTDVALSAVRRLVA